MTQSYEYEPEEMAPPTGAIFPTDGQTLQQVRTPFTTAVAVQKPRDLTDVEDRCLREARMAGESCYYGWDVGDGKRVEGASIECAMIAVRNWGNCALVPAPVQETGDSFIFTGYFVDIETGVTIPRQFRQSKDSIIYGRMDKERKMDIRFQIGQSKCFRNAALRALPKWLIDRMVGEAKKGVLERIQKEIDKEGIENVRQRLVSAFQKSGVKLENIEHRLGKSVKKWEKEELAVLYGDLKAILDGVESPSTLFPGPEAEEPPEPKQNGLKHDLKKKADKVRENGDQEPAAAEAEPETEPPPETPEKKTERSKFHHAVINADNQCMNRSDCPNPELTNINQLQAHHIRSRAQGGDDSIENGITFCPDCHRWAEEGRTLPDGSRQSGRQFVKSVLETLEGSMVYRWPEAYKWLCASVEKKEAAA